MKTVWFLTLILYFYPKTGSYGLPPVSRTVPELQRSEFLTIMTCYGRCSSKFRQEIKRGAKENGMEVFEHVFDNKLQLNAKYYKVFCRSKDELLSCVDTCGSSDLASWRNTFRPLTEHNIVCRPEFEENIDCFNEVFHVHSDECARKCGTGNSTRAERSRPKNLHEICNVYECYLGCFEEGVLEGCGEGGRGVLVLFFQESVSSFIHLVANSRHNPFWLGPTLPLPVVPKNCQDLIERAIPYRQNLEVDGN